MTDPYADLRSFKPLCTDTGCPIEWDFPADPSIGGLATWPGIGEKRRIIVLCPDEAIDLYGDTIGGWVIVAERWTHGDQPKETVTFRGLDEQVAKDLFVNASHTTTWAGTLDVIRTAYRDEPTKIGDLP